MEEAEGVGLEQSSGIVATPREIAAFATAFLLFPASWQVGHVFRSFQLPTISGYLLTGVLCGPHGLAVLTEDSTEALWLADDVCLAVVALAAGCELKFKDINTHLKAVSLISICVFCVTWSVSFSSLLGMASNLDFLKHLSPRSQMSAAGVAATIMVARSPASAIAVMREVDAKGRFTTVALTVSILIDVCIIVTFSLVVEFAHSVHGGGEFNLGASIMIPVAHVAFTLVLGVAAGWVIDYTLRRTRRVELNIKALAPSQRHTNEVQDLRQALAPRQRTSVVQDPRQALAPRQRTSVVQDPHQALAPRQRTGVVQDPRQALAPRQRTSVVQDPRQALAPRQRTSVVQDSRQALAPRQRTGVVQDPRKALAPRQRTSVVQDPRQALAPRQRTGMVQDPRQALAPRQRTSVVQDPRQALAPSQCTSVVQDPRQALAPRQRTSVVQDPRQALAPRQRTSVVQDPRQALAPRQRTSVMQDPRQALAPRQRTSVVQDLRQALAPRQRTSVVQDPRQALAPRQRTSVVQDPCEALAPRQRTSVVQDPRQALAPSQCHTNVVQDPRQALASTALQDPAPGISAPPAHQRGARSVRGVAPRQLTSVVGVLVALAGAFFYIVQDVLKSEPLLACVVAGIYAGNRGDRPGEDMLNTGESLQTITSIVLPLINVSFFTLGGAALDVDSLGKTLEVALMLFVSRLFALFCGASLGSWLAGWPREHIRIAWMAFVTQAGVSIGLAKEVAESFPEWGPSLKSLLVAVIVLNQLVGPPLFKVALIQAGDANPALIQSKLEKPQSGTAIDTALDAILP
ncbi:hypothetical protein CYMTET_7114 [Cymbomonas tetramitiformis]|uniref:Cation/H+ exchanger transmembrane domain-containing protein n=1 Tax=Cymbomonas tetramitiformis TaxID=36881 RepID=A0AAE0GXJ2_9CHLO|nr:hypothetical protein CYMTET_7114 [Cymbomonas tetramitiformis]